MLKQTEGHVGSLLDHSCAGFEEQVSNVLRLSQEMIVRPGFFSITWRGLTTLTRRTREKREQSAREAITNR
jgi:hypothetical protein